MHVGVPRVIGCWQVGEVLVDPGPSTGLPALLDALGDDYVPRALLLTHIHLDHAGASGTLARRWPEVEVYVHERGAPHMIDPSRLIESATRLYGEDMERLWGEVVAVPEGRLRVLRGGERLTFEAGGQFDGGLHARTRLPPRLLPPRFWDRVRRRRRRRPDHAGIAGDPADTPPP